jgi:hypothetical protein
LPQIPFGSAVGEHPAIQNATSKKADNLIARKIFEALVFTRQFLY